MSQPTPEQVERARSTLREMRLMDESAWRRPLAQAIAARDAEIRAAERDRCVRACETAVPRAHTYASENADLYRAGDAARDRCISAIRALGDPS